MKVDGIIYLIEPNFFLIVIEENMVKIHYIENI